MRTGWNLQIGCVGLFLLASLAQAETTSLKLSLADLTSQALKNSPKLEAARLSYESAKSEAGSVGASELPRLGLSGNYFYQTYVPAISILPHMPPEPFGEANNWSAWATLNWDLWDFRSQHQLAESATAQSQSQEQAYQATERQVKLAVRLAYFQAQSALEEVRLLGDSLQVAQAQYADIGHQARFGTASRMDLLSAHQEMMNYQRQFRQAQANLSQALRDLFDLLGEKEPADFTFPLDARMQGKLPEGVPAPSVWLAMDSEQDSKASLQKEAAVPPGDSEPQLKTYAYLADSARLAADSVHSGLFPKLSLSAQAGFENPDGPILENIQQNIVGVSLSMPLFDWGQIVSDSDSKRRQSESYLRDLDQAKSDLWRDWEKAQDELSALQYEQGLDDTSVAETKELAELTYVSYRAGTTRYLEVQTANLQKLNAQVTAVDNDIQTLMQLSVLSSLSGKE